MNDLKTSLIEFKESVQKEGDLFPEIDDEDEINKELLWCLERAIEDIENLLDFISEFENSKFKYKEGIKP